MFSGWTTRHCANGDWAGTGGVKQERAGAERSGNCTKIGDAKLALIKEYADIWGTVTDEQALDYLKRSEEIRESVIQLWKNTYRW